MEIRNQPRSGFRREWTFLAIFAVGYAGQILYAGRVLPDPVASHFNWRGEPDDTMSLRAYLIFMALFGVGLPGFFIGLSKILRMIPVSMINLPHREYWFAPERIEIAMQIFTRLMTWLACGMLVFFMGIHQLVIVANLSRPVQLPTIPFLVLLGIGFVSFLTWMAMLYRSFRIPE
ncbi:MAG: DUF1648 domain-containing protein [Planctomycetaceae bacterium]